MVDVCMMRTALKVLYEKVDDVCNRRENKKKSWCLCCEHEKRVVVKE